MTRRRLTPPSEFVRACRAKADSLPPVYIYALTDPDETVRYIGRSIDPRRRFRAHFSSKQLPAVRAWLRSLCDSGQLPGLVILEKTRDHNASRREMAHIYAHDQDSLLNVRGNGRPGRCRFCGSTEHMAPRCRAPESPFRDEPLLPVKGRREIDVVETREPEPEPEPLAACHALARDDVAALLESLLLHEAEEAEHRLDIDQAEHLLDLAERAATLAESIAS